MSTLIKSAINYKVSCFVNFKEKDGREFVMFQPKVQQKNKDTGAYEDKKYLFIEEAYAMIDVLTRAITLAQDRLAPNKQIGESKHDGGQAEHNSYSNQNKEPEQPTMNFNDDDIPF